MARINAWLVCFGLAVSVVSQASGADQEGREPRQDVATVFHNSIHPVVNHQELIASSVDAAFGVADDRLAIESLTADADFSLFQTVVRGQNAPYDERPAGVGSSQSPVMILPPQTGQSQTMMPGWPGIPMTDPWGGQAGPTQFGAVGPQPFRYGWQLKFDVGNLFAADTTNLANAPTGEFDVFEFNGELRHTMPLQNQWIFSVAPQLGYRGWSGPRTPALPGDAYRAGIDLGLTTPAMGPYTMEFGFNPAIGTDFERKPKSNALMWDGRGAIFVRTAPQWLWVLGAQYWDRVNDQIVPWAGLVFTPDDRWEVRAVFPNPQVSAFLGTPWGVPAWLYLAGEYHVEAYDVNIANSFDQIEMKDWRVVLGLRTEQNGVTSFIEGGWVMGRKARFRGPTAGFDIDDGFIVRGGMKF